MVLSVWNMWRLLLAGSVFFPGLFLVCKLLLLKLQRWAEGDAVMVSARVVSSIQAIMASSAGYIIASSCQDIVEDQHWLTSAYILFAVPYFAYDIYAMFLCHWYKTQVKGHEATPLSAAIGYLRREFLMVLHHVVMVLVCFPVSVFWRQGKGDYFQGVMFLAEMSTPSVCLGKILIQVCLHPSVLGAAVGSVAVQCRRFPADGAAGLLVLPHLQRSLQTLHPGPAAHTHTHTHTHTNTHAARQRIQTSHTLSPAHTHTHTHTPTDISHYTHTHTHPEPKHRSDNSRLLG
ncbi:ceramide synthase-like isoform X1 [Sardina pilchardus]|uniref:ceramide synthase-like isoform X1 n=1 Tax=Sardina pilchardus TaxID=27697 RepID=UPI002E160E05